MNNERSTSKTEMINIKRSLFLKRIELAFRGLGPTKEISSMNLLNGCDGEKVKFTTTDMTCEK